MWGGGEDALGPCRGEPNKPMLSMYKTQCSQGQVWGYGAPQVGHGLEPWTYPHVPCNLSQWS